MTGRESHLHKALKEWYLEKGDLCEARVEGGIADILRPRKRKKDRDLVIEIQTGSFGKLAPKLPALLENYIVRVVYPLTIAKKLVVYAGDGEKITSSRMSPRHDSVYAVFNELFRIPHLLNCPYFQFEALLTVQEEVRVADGAGSWRRKGVSILEKRLVEVSGVERFYILDDFCRLIPAECSGVFTCSRLSRIAGCSRKLAQKMAYCLSRAGLLACTGKEGREHVYTAR